MSSKKDLKRQLKDSQRREHAFAYERDQLMLKLMNKRCACHNKRHVKEYTFVDPGKPIDQAGGTDLYEQDGSK